MNPQTLEPMQIAGYDTLDFKPGSELKQALGEARGSKRAKAKTKKTTAKAKTNSKSKSRARTKTAAKSKPSTQRKKVAAVAKGKSKSKRSSTRKASAASEVRAATSIAGRRLKRRDELEYADYDDLALPQAPMQRARGQRRRKLEVEPKG